MVDNDALSRILDEEVLRHPGLAASDLLKLVYQAVFGGDHLFARPDRFRVGLEEEWRTLESAHHEDEAIQKIDPEGRVARLHLGVCRQAGVDVHDLAMVLLGQPRRAGTPEAFWHLWGATIACVRTRSFPVAADELETLDLPSGPPHHGPGYGPASYRILNDLNDPPTRARLIDWGLLR